MNVSDENKEQLMRDYWLGRLPADQSETLETQWFSNDDEAELLEALRSDLIQDYLSRNLSGDELLNFEKNFLNNNFGDVALAKSYFDLPNNFVESSDEVGFFEKLRVGWWNLIKTPQFAIGLVLLGVITPLAIFFWNSSKPVEISQNTNNVAEKTEINNAVQNNSTEVKDNEEKLTNSDTGNVKVKTETNQNTVKPEKPLEKNVNKAETTETKAVEESKVKTEKSPAQTEVKPVSPVLYLSVMRGGSRTLTLSNQVNNFSLKLDMPGIDKAYKSYEVRIYDENNTVVLQQTVRENLSTKRSGEKINVRNLQTSKLKKQGSYRVSLVGIDEKKSATELNNYETFKVN
jgi:hypothetical protein